MDQKNRIRSAFLLVVAFAPMLLLFQNCGPAKVSGSISNPSNSPSVPVTDSGSSIIPTSTATPTPAPTPTPFMTPVMTPTPTPTPAPTPVATPTPVSSSAKAIRTYEGACLDVYQGQDDDGIAIVQYDCNGGINQKFSFNSLGNSNYMIVANTSGKCLDVGGAATTSGSTVLQWTCASGALNQTWQYISNADGSFKLKDMNSQKCLTYPAFDPAGDLNQQLYISTCSSTKTNQLFYF